MAVFKCKMCGGNLDIQDGSSVVECEYCGTKQTLPNGNDEIVVNMFNRANNLRLKYEFDKAAEVYEKILDIDNSQAEAHWGIVLCKYGIEYVEDPQTRERIPTCHRTQLESILTDADYQAALSYADVVAQSVYESQARAINEIQKKILQIVKSENPFDVFICYKETDDSGSKTRDSVIANEIYHELTNSGLKVFYAAITLEDKLGQEYEPYIYAALTSAKVMLVLGTKPEYFNAVWVKNEWARYLHLMRTDRGTKRTLIPCFRDMDAYDLPDDFSHLQALDMSGIAFMPDLIRNIGKLVGKTQGLDEGDVSVSVVSLLKRVSILLEDGEFARADELLEEILNRDPENARAYVGKMMISHSIRREEDIGLLPHSLLNDRNYEKALRFADDEYKQTLLQYEKSIADHIIEEKYLFAVAKKNQGQYIEASGLFERLGDYKDSVQQKADCIELENQRIYNSAAELKQSGDYLGAAKLFAGLGEYTDAKQQNADCIELENQRIYDSGVDLKQKKDYVRASKIFAGLGSFRDAKQQSEICIELENQRIYDSGVDLKQKKDYVRASKIFAGLGSFKDAKQQSEICIELENQRIYDSAVELMQNGEYIQASGVFSGIAGFKDAKQQSLNCVELENQRIYDSAERLKQKGDFREASKVFAGLGTFKDAKERVVECDTAESERIYQSGKSQMDSKNFVAAQNIFRKLGNYKDAKEKADECHNLELERIYQYGISILNDEQFTEAMDIFKKLGDYKDAKQQVLECHCGIICQEARVYGERGAYFVAIQHLDQVQNCQRAMKHKKIWEEKIRDYLNDIKRRDIFSCIPLGLILSLITVPIIAAIAGVFNVVSCIFNGIYPITTEMWYFIIISVVIATILLQLLIDLPSTLRREFYECEHCGHLSLTNTQPTGVQYQHTDLVCPQCGHTHWRERKVWKY